MAGYSVPPDLLPYLTGSKKDFSTVQDSIIKVNSIFLPLIALSTGSRFFVRFHMLRAAGIDDFLMIVALLFAILLSTCCLLGEHFGLGKHLWNLDSDLLNLPADVARTTKVLFGCYLSYSTAITFTKFSVVATYLRIFPPGGSLRWLVYSVAVVVFSFWISSIFAIIFTCVPVEAAWDYTIKDARCYGVLNYFYVAAGFNIATDLLLCVLPMSTFWALSMPKSQRIILCMLFGIGFFACIASTLRLTQLHNLGGFDITYMAVGSLNWSVIEVGTALICASLSALRPLATKYFPSLFAHFSQPTGLSTTAKASQFHTNFEMISAPGSRCSGHIHVQKSFEVFELSQLPPIPGRVSIRSGEVFSGRTAFEDTSSEDDLVSRS